MKNKEKGTKIKQENKFLFIYLAYLKGQGHEI